MCLQAVALELISQCVYVYASARYMCVQAVALEQLKHSYICGYKEFFVVWDSEVSPCIHLC